MKILEVDTNGFLFSFNPQFGSDFTFAIDEPGNLIYIGNYNGPFANKPYLFIDVLGQSVQIGMDTPPTSAIISLEGAAGDITATAANDFQARGNNSAVMKANGNVGYEVAGNILKMGDYIGTGNFTFLSIDDGVKKLTYQKNADPYFIIDIASSQYILGDFHGANKADALFFEIQNDVVNNFVSVRSASVGSPYFFLLDKANGVYEIGDINSTGNGSFLKIDDTTGNLTYTHLGIDYLSIKPIPGNFILATTSIIQNYSFGK